MTIRLVAELTLKDKTVPFAIPATVTDDMASLRPFETAGLRPERKFDSVIAMSIPGERRSIELATMGFPQRDSISADWLQSGQPRSRWSPGYPV